MNSHIQLKIARRRVQQRNGAASFLGSINSETGTTLSEGDLIEPATSVKLELATLDTVTDGDLHFLFAWEQELTRIVLASRISEMTAEYGDSAFAISLFHHWDYAFYMTFERFAKVAVALLEFDGDTVFAIKQDCSKAIAFDLYTSEICQEIRFAIGLSQNVIHRPN